MWVYNGSGRSLIVVGHFHSAFNITIGNEVMPELLNHPASETSLMCLGVLVVLAVAVVGGVHCREIRQPWFSSGRWKHPSNFIHVNHGMRNVTLTQMRRKLMCDGRLHNRRSGDNIRSRLPSGHRAADDRCPHCHASVDTYLRGAEAVNRLDLTDIQQQLEEVTSE
jgi:hypothetical protein